MRKSASLPCTGDCTGSPICTSSSSSALRSDPCWAIPVRGIDVFVVIGSLDGGLSGRVGVPQPSSLAFNPASVAAIVFLLTMLFVDFRDHVGFVGLQPRSHSGIEVAG